MPSVPMGWQELSRDRRSPPRANFLSPLHAKNTTAASSMSSFPRPLTSDESVDAIDVLVFEIITPQNTWTSYMCPSIMSAAIEEACTKLAAPSCPPTRRTVRGGPRESGLCLSVHGRRNSGPSRLGQILLRRHPIPGGSDLRFVRDAVGESGHPCKQYEPPLTTTPTSPTITQGLCHPKVISPKSSQQLLATVVKSSHHFSPVLAQTKRHSRLKQPKCKSRPSRRKRTCRATHPVRIIVMASHASVRDQPAR